ncbi:MAG: AmmeMemoRadiSam system protein B [Deltaproteobacteria bacterium]|nr:AmmeMemoRadiSam system protein B [Deltaproteobacteria bacterium]
MARAVQPSNLAGTWYPADAEELRRQVETFLGTARAADGSLRAILVPHAGYRYSGHAAGAAYARVGRGRWRRALVLAPSHYHSFAGAAVFPGDGFETPLGIVNVDHAATRMLAASPLFTETARPYAREHSLEIQLPFLQVIDPALQLVPVMVGAADDVEDLAALGATVRGLDDGETLFVISSDFTHYGAHFDYLPFPPDGPDAVSERLRRLDFGAIDRIRAGDADGFVRYVRSTGITICGRGPITAFLHERRGWFAADVVSYYTSLDVTGDFEHCVSYAGIVFRDAQPEAA